MKSKKKIIIISAVGVAVLTVVMVLTLVCFHSWTDATCDTPMTCKKCGKTKGEALSHEWIAATCKEAKHCSRCGITDGEPLAHSFNEATCELPKTCSVCGATEGEPKKPRKSLLYQWLSSLRWRLLHHNYTICERALM